MQQHRARAELSESQRKELFRLLVVAQDVAMTVKESHEMVRARFGLAEDDLIEIEREGLERD